MSFNIDYILGYPNSFVVHQKYWPLIGSITISNTPVKTTICQERIIAVWHVKLKPMVEAPVNNLIVDTNFQLN